MAIGTIPVLGTYKIEAMANKQYVVGRIFEVKDYHLYSIDLNIYPMVAPSVEHQGLNLTVEVKNDLGILLSGIVEIDLYLFDEKLDSPTKWEVNGERQVYLPFTKKQVILKDTYDVRVKVNFTEQYTNRTVVVEEVITVYSYKYKVTHDSRLTYRPGSPFTATLKVTDLNGEPANNITLLVEIGGVENLLAQKYTSNGTGYATIFMHTNKSTKINYLQVLEGNHVELNETIYELEGDSNMFIEVKLLTRVKFNRIVKLMVSCSHGMSILLYYVICKDNIVDAGFFRPNQMNRYPFQVIMSTRLLPLSKLVVATILNNEIILDSVDLLINELGNPLEIEIEENISEDGVEPGDEIELAIRGRPGSFVALTAYDQRLQQCIEHNDIFHEDIWDMFKSFYMFYGYEFNSIYYLELFTWISDQTITISERYRYEERGIYPDEPRFGMPGPYRTEFFESWLWQNVTIPASGRIGLVVTVPHSTTTWCISGFSMHPKYGLGSVQHPTQFSTKKIIYLLDQLPESIKRGETISLHFTLFSTINETFEATVTMFNAKNQLLFLDGPSGDSTESKIVDVMSNSPTPVSFVVKPMKLGELEIRLNASIMQGVISDTFKKIIKVLPEDLHEGKQVVYFGNSFDIPLVGVKKGCLQVELSFLPIVPARGFSIINDFNVSLTYGSMQKMFLINPNSTLNTKMEHILDTKHIHVTVIVNDLRIITVNWRVRPCYSFNIEITKQATATKLLKQLNVCCSFIPEIVGEQSNDTLVEVSIPIGYAMDNHSVQESTTSNPIDKIEILHDGTTLMVHYKNIGVERTCFSVFVYKRFTMPVKHPSYIRVQDLRRTELSMAKMFDFYDG
ncbi:CD109 antigen-like isoform X1 [Anopheles albimanus]|nr:CD109 antigen-like isoform X1 [Anopheles albimanus]